MAKYRVGPQRNSGPRDRDRDRPRRRSRSRSPASHFDDRDRDRDRWHRDRSPPRRGGNGYRPPPRSYADYDAPPPPPSYPPPDSYDSYRPPPPPSPGGFRPPQGDFTFRMDKPAGVGHSGRGDNRRGNWWQKKRDPWERPMLKLAQAAPQQEIMFGVETGNAPKYRAVNELSDDEEAEMVMSDDDKARDDGPAKKRARVSEAEEPADNVPKWSNPDPYSVLPPTEDNNRKKVDMVKLIRKARLDSEATKAAATDSEDFISFDMDDSPKGKKDKSRGKDKAGRGGRSRSNSPHERERPGSRTPARERRRSQSPSRNERQRSKSPTRQPLSKMQRPPGLPDAPAQAPLPPPPGLADLPQTPIPRKLPDPLGSRKRTIDDEIKPPTHHKPKGSDIRIAARGLLLPEWRPLPSEDECPWNTVDHSETSHPSVWLHKEIVDFYEYVRPRSFEQKIRERLMSRLKAVMVKNYIFQDYELKPFGSYVSGLYLPTGDMDLVVCSRAYLAGRGNTHPKQIKNNIFKFRGMLVSNRLADASTIECILGAKVPLVKYVDKETGLKVDISFDNLSGVDACETFMTWTKMYPSMPILVTLVKHLLSMRGLNEPVSGGIGGFSVICLVVSMLQMMPQVQSGSLTPESHLGEMLVEFLSLYGKTFNHEKVAIRVNPPGYVEKSLVTQIIYKPNNRDRLSIIDPNNPANDISGGSASYPVVKKTFEEAHKKLIDAMTANPPTGQSLLKCIIGGNYSSFRQQRKFLQRIYEKHYGPCGEE